MRMHSFKIRWRCLGLILGLGLALEAQDTDLENPSNPQVGEEQTEPATKPQGTEDDATDAPVAPAQDTEGAEDPADAPADPPQDTEGAEDPTDVPADPIEDTEGPEDPADAPADPAQNTEEDATDETTEEPQEDPGQQDPDAQAPNPPQDPQDPAALVPAQDSEASPADETAPPAQPEPVLAPRERRFGPLSDGEIFLNLPVKTDAPKRRMRLSVDGKTLREFDIELSEDPDFWVSADLSAFSGKTVTVTVDALEENSPLLEQITTGTTLMDAEDLYQEALRPQFHFSAQRGWINDPNGLVYYRGTYHLFFQHNPYGWNWGNMHWGHATSPDLVHWKQQPIAIYPHAYDDWAFSGGAVVDHDNTSGFQEGDDPVMVAFYTSTGRGECVVYSNDGGDTWTEYEGNPVIEHQGRDPKVIWHDSSRQWVMAVYDEHEDGQHIAFYTSPDLKDWTFQSRISGFYECPELFEIDLDLDPIQPKWILYGADGDYLVGSFDGKTFTPEGEKIKGNYGNCFYASQMFSNLPAYDRRHVQLAWGRIPLPGMPFNQQMLFPCTLRLHSTEEGPRLFTTPVREILRLHQSTDVQENTALNDTLSLTEGELLDIDLTFSVGQAQSISLNVRGVPIEVDLQAGQLTCLEQSAPVFVDDGEWTLRLLVDRASIEIFASNGRVYMPIGVALDPEKKTVTVAGEGNPTLKKARVAHLKSIWQ